MVAPFLSRRQMCCAILLASAAPATSVAQNHASPAQYDYASLAQNYQPQGCIQQVGCNQCCDSTEAECCNGIEKAEKCDHGPGPCHERGTLFQWSYGTSFEGGPPGYDEPLATDRPDFTEATVTVGRGVAQLEVGYTYFHDISAGDLEETHSYPDTLLRVGLLAQWLEMRVAWTYLDLTSAVGAAVEKSGGASDLNLGFKIALTPQEGILPEMALIPEIFVPVGDGRFTAGEVLPGLLWVYSWEINDRITTAGETVFSRAIDDETGRPFVVFAQSWVIGYTLTERWGAYTEWFAFVPDGADSARTQHFADGGFTFLVNNNLQLDVRVGVGLSEASEDYFIGAGFAQRF